VLRSTFDPGEVTLLLQDLSDAPLERTLAEREANAQGGGHYAEVLPVEYEPGPAYLTLFEQLLDELAERIAEHVGVVTEIALAERGGHPVLVSLARAGTPVGVLMRRWAARHGVEVPHYSISIVRDRGIDTVALAHVAARHDPRDVVFVDGWTGKGAIATELTEALRGTPFRPDLAVVADPGGCATMYGTRDDVLLPSACLNATVCGLVSRTVLNAAYVGPGDLHGAKVYWDLQPQDRTAQLLDAVSGRYDDVAERVAKSWRTVADGPRTPVFSGLAAVRRVQEEYALPSWHLVKPSIGETTRVLLRRLPSRVLVRPDRVDDLRHVLALAEERGVPVTEHPDMPYACMGLVAPA